VWIVDQQFKYCLDMPITSQRRIDEIRDYLIRNIGYQTYYLSRAYGGKQWKLERNPGNGIKIHLNDEAQATYIQLRYS
jgi:hypothetical protein